MEQDKPLIETSARNHIVFAVVTLLYWTSLYTYVPILSPYLLDYLEVGAAMTGIVLGSYGLMQILLRLPIGLASDRLRKRRPFIAMGMLTGALSCLLFAMGEQPGWALAARAVSGISASTWVAFTVLYAAYYPKNSVGKAMSSISFLVVAGQIIGMGLSGWLAGDYGYIATFYAGIAAGLIGLVIAFFIKEPAEGISRTPIQLGDLAVVMRSPMLWRVSILSILAHSVLFITMFGFTPSYATLNLGASSWDLSLLSFAFMVPHAVMQLLSGRVIAPKIGTWTTIAIGFVLSAACTIAIPFAGSLQELYITQAVNGLAQGMHLPLLLALSITGVASDKQATAMGFYQAVYAAGMFGGPFVAGWVNEFGGLDAGFWLGGGIAALSLAVTFLFARRHARELRAAEGA